VGTQWLDRCRYRQRREDVAAIDGAPIGVRHCIPADPVDLATPCSIAGAHLVRRRPPARSQAG
jgi:hypothetical protein